MKIRHVEMTRRSWQAGINSRRMLVIHATAGHAPSDYNWLRHGGGIVNGRDKPVSIHYYISKKGVITQFLDDKVIAWHAGPSTWIIDGHQVMATVNPFAIGIELENLNDGLDPYPISQYTSLLSLSRSLVAKYHIPRKQLVRHSDVAPGRKDDPKAFPWPTFVERVYAIEKANELATDS
jgi:N-acetylmuramoyl-L-alanine amidase